MDNNYELLQFYIYKKLIKKKEAEEILIECKKLNSITSKIQPVMLLIVGAIVGTLFIAVYAPLLSMMNGLGNTGY